MPELGWFCCYFEQYHCSLKSHSGLLKCNADQNFTPETSLGLLDCLVPMPAKIRAIRAFVEDQAELFEFNKSISPRGGTLGKIKLSRTKNDFVKIKIFQDFNRDLVISKSEVIFKGKTSVRGSFDDLLNFSGRLKLKRQMHDCFWKLQKNPGKPLACTLDYVPTLYWCTLVDSTGLETFDFDGVGKFATPSGYLL